MNVNIYKKQQHFMYRPWVAPLFARSLNIKYRFMYIILDITSVDTDLSDPDGKCGCQYYILLTLTKKIHGHGPGFFLIKN
jgi:hypothetical protein